VTAGPLFITNCTIAGNAAVGGAGGSLTSPGGNAYGGGIHGSGAPQGMVLVNATIASNATSVTGPSPIAFSFGANLATSNYMATLRNSILAYPGSDQNVSGPVTDGGHNICSDGSAAFASGTSLNSTDPALLPLANYGGPTHTMALAANSPALDAAPSVDAPAYDQRRFPRPFGNGVDIGAFELGPTVPPLLVERNQAAVRISFVGQENLSYRLERSDSFAAWELQQSTGPLTSNGLWSTTFAPAGLLRFYRLALEY